MISLYREGTSHVVRGVECELIRVSIDKFKQLLDEGWHTCLDELYQNQNQSTVPTGKELRDEAKAAGLDDWKTARFAKLQKELGYGKD